MITIRTATADDLTWINQKYDEVDFIHSTLINERVVIASVHDEPAGLGRMVEISQTIAELGGIYVFAAFRNQGVAREIVSYLLKNAKKYLKEIYCLPFKNLAAFYGRFGFSPHTGCNDIPLEIQKKYNWCNQHYPSDVLLLYLKKGDEE